MRFSLTRHLLVYTLPEPRGHRGIVLNMGNRQEFYVRFKGPEESQYILIYLAHTVTDGLQHPSKADYGKSTSSYPTNTLISHRVSASLTAYSTQTLTSCMFYPKQAPEY
jgi:hypothetical protein